MRKEERLNLLHNYLKRTGPRFGIRIVYAMQKYPAYSKDAEGYLAMKDLNALVGQGRARKFSDKRHTYYEALA